MVFAVQVLHLMNSAKMQAKINSEDGAVTRVAESDWESGQIIDWLYLSCYSREPTASEIDFAREVLDNRGRKEAIQDLLWAMLNTPEFVFVD